MLSINKSNIWKISFCLYLNIHYYWHLCNIMVPYKRNGPPIMLSYICLILYLYFFRGVCMFTNFATGLICFHENMLSLLPFLVCNLFHVHHNSMSKITILNNRNFQIIAKLKLQMYINLILSILWMELIKCEAILILYSDLLLFEYPQIYLYSSYNKNVDIKFSAHDAFL